MDLKKNQEAQVYIKISGTSPITVPLELMRKESSVKLNKKENIIYGIYFGILIVTILYNLFIFFSLKEPYYLYYVAYVFCLGAIFSASSGYSFTYIYPNTPIVNYYLSKIMMGIIVLFTSLFAQRFLNLKKYSTWVYKILRFNMYACVVAIVLSVSGIYASACNDLLNLHSPMMFVAGIVTWIKGNKSARLYTIAWSIFLIGAISVTLRNSGILPTNSWTTHTVEVGSAIEIVLLSLALAERYRLLRKEKEAATRRALEIQKEANLELEHKVQERTQELSVSNEELLLKNKQINESIHYAERIQRAILPLEDNIASNLYDNFVLFKPRDIVSGDFYWFEKLGNKQIFVVGDCTGHGVPGAFMSMLGVQALNDIVFNQKVTKPSEILSTLDTTFSKVLQSEHTLVGDGMDAVVCVIDHDNEVVEYAGAKNPLIVVDKNGELREIKGGRHSVNSGLAMMPHINQGFPNHSIPIGDIKSMFMFSDGYQDQFGGEKGKKFMKKKFFKLLNEASNESCLKQKDLLENRLRSWMGNYDQVDDILVVGVKFNI